MVEDADPPVARPFRDIPWSVMIALVLNLVAGVWFASGMDQRIIRVETRQVEQAADIGRLDRAREDTNLHVSKLDSRLDNMDSKLQAILDIVQQWDPPPTPDSQQPEQRAPAPNFRKPPAPR